MAFRIVIEGPHPETGESGDLVQRKTCSDAGSIYFQDSGRVVGCPRDQYRAGGLDPARQHDGLQAHTQPQVTVGHFPVHIGMGDLHDAAVSPQGTAGTVLAEVDLADLEAHDAVQVRRLDAFQLETQTLDGKKFVHRTLVGKGGIGVDEAQVKKTVHLYLGLGLCCQTQDDQAKQCGDFFHMNPLFVWRSPGIQAGTSRVFCQLFSQNINLKNKYK